MKLIIEAVDSNILFTNSFNGLDDKERLNIVNDHLRQSKNSKNISKAYSYHLSTIANESDRHKRLSYLWFLEQLPYPIEESTANLIKEFWEEGRIVFKKDRWLYDPTFYRDENTTTLNNKIKVVSYFNDESNRDKWVGASDILSKFKKQKDGTWKTYAEISKVIDQVEKQNPSTPTSEMEEASQVLRSLNPELTKRSSMELVRKIYNSKDNVEKLVSKALQSMGR